jgi:two-component system, OmpR family, alkaline phosphatase synthesis response regulator PhoP
MNTLLEASPKETANPSNGDEPTRSVRIMVVEDDVDLRYLSTEALIHEGYEVDFAENGVRAWKALHFKRYDLLITDNLMPKMTGLQLVQKLRTAGMQLPVVLASSSLPAEMLLKGTVPGFVAVIRKPFTLDELVGTVKRVLPGSAADRGSYPAATAAETIPVSSKPRRMVDS